MGQATRSDDCISQMASLSGGAERLLRPSEVAEMLDVSTHTLKSWRHRDDYGPHYKRLLGKRGEIRYPLSEVLGFMRSDLHESYAAEVSRRPQGAPDSPETSAVSRGYDSRAGRFVTRSEGRSGGSG